MTRRLPVVIADVPPPVWQLTRQSCADEGRRCGGGDSACRAKAVEDGFTASTGNYQLCRPENVRTEPTVSGFVGLGGGFAIVIVVVIAVAIKRRRGKS